MIQVYPRLYVGSDADWFGGAKDLPDLAVIHAAKEPHHRQALGYTTKAAPEGDKEYYVAYRGHELMLNLIDSPDPKYIPPTVIDAALAFIGGNIHRRDVLVHCNRGESRAPSIALLWMAANTTDLSGQTLADAEGDFILRYPNYSPGSGIRGFLYQNWKRYVMPNYLRSNQGWNSPEHDR